MRCSISVANGLDYFDSVVGFADYAGKGGSTPALVWSQKDGMQDLNDLIPSNSGSEFQAATAINLWGQITGFGLMEGQTHAFFTNTSLVLCRVSEISVPPFVIP